MNILLFYQINEGQAHRGVKFNKGREDMNKNCSLIQNQYWEFRKENKKLRKKERKHTLNKESDQENVKEKNKFLD